MLSTPKMPHPLALEEERAELKAVLESKLLARAPSLVQFLSYVCQKYFEGSASEIKEYSIAVEALGRTSDFRQKEDPIVRVEANRLRKRLKQYYESEGLHHPIQISIPPGQYVPVFHHLPKTPLASDPRSNKLGLSVIEREPIEETASESQTPEAVIATEQLVQHRGTLARTGTVGILATGRRKDWVSGRAMWAAGGLSIGIVLVLLALIGKEFWSSRLGPERAVAARVDLPGQQAVAVHEPDGGPIRILAGSSAVKFFDHSGKLWGADRYFSGGSMLKSPNLAILRTPDPEIYQSFREGDFRYDIPLKPDCYELHLHFAETLYGAEEREGGGETSRLISVSLNGQQILDGLDIVSDAGGSKTAEIKVFKDVFPAADGFLHLNFWSSRSKALLNAIEVLPGIRGQMLPVRITTRSTPYFSKRQVLWSPDSYYAGGRTVLRTNNVVTGTDEPELYKSERFGNFTYAIPVAEGSYTVTLKFAETYFGATNPGGGGAGSRSFNVYCNGETLLRDQDIYREAGGENRALEKRFYGLKPNAQGKLLLQFVPNRNYACINAIEVISDNGSRHTQ